MVGVKINFLYDQYVIKIYIFKGIKPAAPTFLMLKTDLKPPDPGLALADYRYEKSVR
jgi:hypothetical protein